MSGCLHNRIRVVSWASAGDVRRIAVAAARRWPWKYMRFAAEYESMPGRGLYNIEHDAHEAINLIDLLPQQAAEMDELLSGYVGRVTGGGPDPLKEQEITHAMTAPEARTKY